MYALAVFSVALLAGQVSGYALSTRSPIYALLKRQADDGGDDVPAQCQSVCAAFENAANDPSCVDPSCLCATAVAQSFVGCLDCALSLDPDPSLEAEAQEDLSSFSEACSQAGVNVGSLSLSVSATPAPTGSADGSLPTASDSNQSIFFSTISKTDTDAPASTSASASGSSGSSSGSGGSSGSQTAQKNSAMGRAGASALLVAGAALLAFAL
ncbi:hypothetical protein CERSUDRAFT_89281 [Gelatoporia subvermispora B]|uniref:Extracellular membrane protein CFEM domain-containing protein n=1 Tax=Ceriporiopsis subvermispora (strain B) TaxID=914234 RepID=M2P747_CERS8|nr:hypothetical protein CERSUDRAFT_89281 [Gelatoporia subvermispora B]